MLFYGKILAHGKVKSGRKSSIKKKKTERKQAQRREKEYHSAVKCAMQTKRAIAANIPPGDSPRYEIITPS